MTRPPRELTSDRHTAVHSSEREVSSPGDMITQPPVLRAGLVANIASAAFGLALFLLPLRWVRLGAMNGLGLISVLPVVSLAGLALLICSFAAMLGRRRPVPIVLAAMLIAIVVCLDGVTAIVEPLPRFATTYQVYGFVSYVRHTGTVAPGLTAYFSWPGFFALIALGAGAAGTHSLLGLLSWWPVIIDALILVPFMMLTSALRITWRARWLAALVLCAGNWVGQDYFSPQSLNFLLYLSFLAILLTFFAGQARPKPDSGGLPGERPAAAASAPQRVFLLIVLVGIFAASTVSHQLTPFLMIASCAGLVIAGRCAPRGLPVLLAVIVIGWVSYAAVGYWSGHMATIFGQVGNLGGTVSSSVGQRLTGGSLHEYPVSGRVVLAGLIGAMACLGLVRRWRGRVSDRALMTLLAAPLGVAALQNYGGEIALRIFLFALPAAAVAASCLFFPQTGEDQAGEPAASGTPAVARAGRGKPLVAVGAGTLAAVLLAGLFVLSRYGNEAFEQIPRGEKAAMDYIYDHARGGTSVLWLTRPAGVDATPQMPWQYRDLTAVEFVSSDSPRDPSDTARAVAELKRLGRGAYLIVTATEAAFLRQTASFPPDWARRFRASLARDEDVRVVMASKDAAVYQARLPASAPRAQPNLHVFASFSGATRWTPAGLAAFGLAVLLLGALEVVRQVRPDRRRLMRLLALASWPAVVLLLIAVIERFRVIS